MKKTDQFIIKKVLAGDIEAYAILIQRYQSEVIKVISAMLFSREESEDLTQKVFLTAFDQLDRFKLERDFSKWLKGITRNTVRLYLRQNKVLGRRLDAYRSWFLSREQGDEGLVEEQYAALEECIKSLPEHSQSLLKQRYTQKLSMAQLSGATRRSVEAVTKAISRLRFELKSCIKKRLAQL